MALVEIADDAVADALEDDVDVGLADGEVADHEIVDADRQARPLDAAPRPSSRRRGCPRQACIIMNTEPADQACGRQATG